MRVRVLVLAGFAVAASAGFGLGQPAKPTGYLGPGTAPDTIRILPAAPRPGDPTDTADQAIFKATRHWKGDPRWALARSDGRDDDAALLADFSCAVGATLTPDRAPRLAALLARARNDVGRAVDAPKTLYQRKRPFAGNDAPICVDRAPGFAASPEYPSGHASLGWATGLILAELAPDRSTPVLARARAYGESRVICGVHNASAVLEGPLVGSAVVAALHGDAAFRADLEAARKEVAALRTAPGLAPARCSAEAALVAERPW